MGHEEGRAHGCGLCGNRVPALTPQGLCSSCAAATNPKVEPTTRLGSRRGYVPAKVRDRRR